VVSLRIEVLSFKQKEKESLGVARARFMTMSILASTLPFKTICFYNTSIWGLSGETTQLLDTSFGSTFLHCSASEGRNILRKILENTPYTSVCDDSPEDVVEETPEEEPLIVEPEPLATPLEASIVLQVPEPQRGGRNSTFRKYV
jgi:hypothetical protein